MKPKVWFKALIPEPMSSLFLPGDGASHPQSYDSLVLQLSMLFQNLTDGLSNTQVNFLKALIDEVEQISARDQIIEYGLGTSGNVAKIKKSLVSKEIIDISGKQITFLDPLYKVWLGKHYFKTGN